MVMVLLFVVFGGVWAIFGRVTVTDSNETSSTGKFILRALVVSLLLHLLIYTGWREGQTQKWWDNLALPKWLTAVTRVMLPPALPQKLVHEHPSRTELTFVEVDPAQATAEPPKNARFEGARNTVAANREIKKPSDMPNVEGRKEPFIKTTQNAPPKKAAVAPTPPPKPVQPQDIARQTPREQTYVPGDMAMRRPSDKTQTGKPTNDTPETDTVQPTPQPAYQRPRTIQEARERSGTIGAPSSIQGGVSHIGQDPSLDVKGTPLGDYMAHMVEAVSDHWHKLVDDQAHQSGKVVLRFRLHSDGSVSGLNPLKSEVNDLLEAACESGIKDPAPFGKWSPELLQYVGNDYYDITFTFYYEVY